MTTTVRPVRTVALPQDPAPEDTHPIILTTPEEVVRWLSSLAPEEICGHPHSADDCPLARYLNTRNGHPAWGASVGTDGYDLADESYPLPAWAQHFVVRVDHSPTRWKRPAARGITAAEALLLLEDLCASRVDWLSDWMGRQEAQDGSAAGAPGS